ncbi:MAG: hypothetical protein AB1609_15245 [Bacillota bacterium]
MRVPLAAPRRRTRPVRLRVNSLLTVCTIGAVLAAFTGLTGATASGSSASAGSQPAAKADAVLTQVRQAVEAIRDASARLTTEAVDARGRRTRSVLKVAFLRTPGLVRLEIVEPSALADQVYVIDFEKEQVQVYLPVTNQILVQPFAKALPSGVDVRSLSPDRIFEALPGAAGAGKDSSVKLVATEKAGGKTLYVLEAPVDRSQLDGGSGAGAGAGSLLQGLVRGPALGAAEDAAYVRVWIDGSTWLATRVVTYSPSGKELSTLTLSDVRINAGLKPQALRQLPADAEIVEG